jgi:hypothetical protein
VDADREQDREQGADGDEAAGQHREHRDLQHRQRLQPAGAVAGHLGDHKLGAQILAGGAVRPGRRALGDLGHASLLRGQRDPAGAAAYLP